MLTLVDPSYFKNKIVTLCGSSSKYKKEFESISLTLTLLGATVLSSTAYSKTDNTIIPVNAVEQLERGHNVKIGLSNCIVVLDINDEISDSTECFIKYAEDLGKVVIYTSANTWILSSARSL